MQTTNPPFDPPYVSTYSTDDGTKHIETLADGSTRPYVGPIVDLSQTGVSPSQAKAKPPYKPKSTAAKAGDDRTYLHVPFAEKDAAKSIGARWDATAKKWYALAGANLELFGKWRSNG